MNSNKFLLLNIYFSIFSAFLFEYSNGTKFSNMASIIGQSEKRFEKLHFELEHENGENGKKIFGEMFDKELLKKFGNILDEVKERLANNIHHLKGGLELDTEYTMEFWQFLETDEKNLMAKKLSQKVIDRMNEKYEELNEEINEIKGDEGYKKGTGKRKIKRKQKVKLEEIKQYPIKGKSHLDLKALGNSAERRAEREKENLIEEEVLARDLVSIIQNERNSLEHLKEIREMGNKAIDHYMDKICQQINNQENAEKSEPKLKIGNENESGNEKEEEQKHECIAHKKLKRMADDFRRFEFYFWLNRAASRLFDNLNPLAKEMMKIKTESNEEKLFGTNINIKRMLESKELAEIINGLLKKMNLDITIKEWIDHWKETGGNVDEEKEEKEEKRKLEDEKMKDIKWLEEEKKKAKADDKNNDIKGKAKEEDEEEEGTKKLHDEKKKDINIKGKKTKEEKLEEEIREWKIKIRLEVGRVLLAYEKMNESMAFDKYLAIGEAKNIVYVPLLERKSNINFVRSADQLPDPRKINELIFALVVKVKEGKDIGRRSMNARKL